MKSARTVITLLGTVLAGRTALARIQQARQDGDKVELLDAALNGLVVVTGVIVIMRRTRRGKSA